MMKKIIKISVLVLFVILVINGCKKGDNSPSNPYNGKTTAVFNTGLTYGTMTDQDGNIYKTITIGTQTWMAENLRTTKYRDSTEIPNVTDNTAWEALTTGAYCNYNNTTSADTIATYGRLYNWYAATDSRNIAPAGWHVPTDAEWTTLTTYLGGESVAGGKMKETGITHWISPNTGATNESGFSALPSGTRNWYDDFDFFIYLGVSTNFWSTTAYMAPYSYSCFLVYCVADAYCYSFDNKLYGYAVRLIKD
jgi:uncharacterized protein (TIGR02145 family)